MDVELNSLMVFRDLAATGNFSETGRRMGMTQPTVSLTISQLESSVGLVLLERHASGAKLTPAGSVFLERAGDVCDAYAEFNDAVRSQSRRLDGEVWVSVDGSWHAGQFAMELEPELAGSGVRFFRQTAGLDWNADLEAGRVDVVIASRFLQEGMTAGIQEAVMKEERGITVAWHPSFYPFRIGSFNFPEVLRSTLLIPSSHVARGFEGFLRHWCDYAYGLQGANTICFEGEEEAARAADAGLGIFLAPGDAMDRLNGLKHELSCVRTFEFLLPEAYRVGVYCRADERAKEVLNIATKIGKVGRRRFSH